MAVERLGTTHPTRIDHLLEDVGEIVDDAREELTQRQFEYFLDELQEETEKQRRGLR